jgi:hypothetical protein
VNPFSVALRGKGLSLLSQRAVGIMRTYGFVPTRMESNLLQYAAVLQKFSCSATLPVVSLVLHRNAQIIRSCQEQGLEIAVHGRRHVDHSTLSPDKQRSELASALHIFDQHGISVKGFRGPYLHANADTLLALQQLGLTYDGSQALDWGPVQGTEHRAYQHALDFYGALSTRDYPSVPSLEGSLVRIPYSLPDDEALLHRLSPGSSQWMSETWLAILYRSHELGELFTLGLHPERIAQCHRSLEAVLTIAHRLVPSVWIARLDEIAAWWKARAATAVAVVEPEQGSFRVEVSGPAGTRLLIRDLEVEAPMTPWSDGYQLVHGTAVTVRSAKRPFIGFAPGADPRLLAFVQEQGYIVETSENSGDYECYLGQSSFAPEDRRPLLVRIEDTARTVVRLGRWPDGARSALAVSGDIDALTMWDYGLRLLGR